MNTISMESHQEQITELQSQIEELESEKHCLEEELKDTKVEFAETNQKSKGEIVKLKYDNALLRSSNDSLKKANQTLLSIYNEDSKKIYDLQNLNNKLVKSNKAANRDFFILAAAYVATLALMIYLFIR